MSQDVSHQSCPSCGKELEVRNGLLYFILFETLWGATLGKFMLGERVATLEGKRAPFSKIMLRNLLWPVDAALWYISVIMSLKKGESGSWELYYLSLEQNHEDL